MSYYWLVFPILQITLSVAASIIIGRYGLEISKHLGSGLMQKMTISIALVAIFLGLYTIILLLGYFIDFPYTKHIAHTFLLIISIVLIVLANYMYKFAVELKKLETGE